MSTITDVAKAAGVSVATVSRALRGLDRVSPATRERVLEVARELNYVASPTATSLALGRTRVVGVITPFVERWFFATVLSAVDKTLRSDNHNVLLLDLEAETYDRRLRLTPEMLSKRVDGAIAVNTAFDSEELEVLSRLGLPVVTIGSPIAGHACVRIDDRAAARTGAEHLLDLGHRRIGYIGRVPEGAAHFDTPSERLRGFRRSLADRGLAVADDHVIMTDWSAEGARRDVAPLLRRPDRPTAILAASDEMAFGVCAAARDAGLSVPSQLSVVGIDDHHLSATWGLTTVRQDVVDQGRRAARLMLETLGDSPPAATTTLTGTELVRRETSAPPVPDPPG